MNRGRDCTTAPEAIPPRMIGNGGASVTFSVAGFYSRKTCEKRRHSAFLFVDCKEIVKAHCTHHVAAVDGAQTPAGLESARTAWVAAQCERPSGQEFPSDDVIRFSTDVGAAKNREPGARRKFQVFSLVLWKNVAKDMVDTRWVLTWKAVEGRRTEKARLVARGFQDPDLAAVIIDIQLCEPSLPSSPGDFPVCLKKMEAVESGH